MATLPVAKPDLHSGHPVPSGHFRYSDDYLLGLGDTLLYTIKLLHLVWRALRISLRTDLVGDSASPVPDAMATGHVVL